MKQSNRLGFTYFFRMIYGDPKHKNNGGGVNNDPCHFATKVD
jgi:hypothetical protein